jgi:hypothetical protein
MPEFPPFGFPALPAAFPPVVGEPLVELLPAVAPAAPPVPAPPPPSTGASEQAKFKTQENRPTNESRVTYADIFIATPRASGTLAEVKTVFV